jgi:hypothetical protein
LTQFVAEMDTCATPVSELRARVLIVEDEPSGACLVDELLRDVAPLDLHGRKVLRRLKKLLESLGFVPLAVVTAEASRFAMTTDLFGRTEAGPQVHDLMQTRGLFADLAAACLALEHAEPVQPKT